MQFKIVQVECEKEREPDPTTPEGWSNRWALVYYTVIEHTVQIVEVSHETYNSAEGLEEIGEERAAQLEKAFNALLTTSPPSGS